ncbi:MAG TPA: hypothetical protein VFS32_07425 [Candidatus Limnocylindrales bacterium]|nr:hypothetical protein [Candidatus Limnocylindrales bacterium]
MAITGARRRGRAIPATALPVEPEPPALPAEPLPIGLPDVNVTSCPVCARPIALGTARCPGCRTRLLLGVPARRAGAFVGVGLALGLAIGAVATAGAIGVGSSLPGGATARGASPVPSLPVVGAVPTASLGSLGTPRPSTGVPPQAGAALGQAIVVNRRLAARATELQSELDAKPTDTFAIATSLRALAADAVVGAGAVRTIGTWPDAQAMGGRLGDYYALVSSTATSTLAASLTDPAAYRDGANAMLRVLADLGPIARDAEAIASGAHIVVPSPATPS